MAGSLSPSKPCRRTDCLRGDEVGYGFRAGNAYTREGDKTVMDVVVGDPDGDGANISSDPTKRSTGSGYILAGAVDITESC